MNNTHAVQLFLDMLVSQQQASPHTCDAYRRDLQVLEACLAGRLFVEATPENLSTCISHPLNQTVHSKTLARRLSAWRRFYQFLVSDQICAINPTQHLTGPKIQPTIPKVLSQSQMQALLGVLIRQPDAQRIRLSVLVELLYATGLRVSELVSLTLSAIQGDGLYVTGKGNKARIIPLTQPAQEALAQYMLVRPLFLRDTPQESPWLFPSRGQTHHLTRQRVGQILKALAVEAGLDPRQVSPHIIRHAFATHLLEGGADLIALQTVLGHASVGTTQIYTHVQEQRMKETVYTKHPLAQTKP